MYYVERHNPFATLAKIGIGMIIERTAPQLSPFYHTANLVTARNPVDFSVSTASLATCKAMQQSFRW